MRELLLLSPLDVPLKSLVVIVVMSYRSILKGLSVVDLLGLREPGAGGFSPTVVEVKEHVVKVAILVADRLNLVEVCGDVRGFIQILGPYLTDVEIDQVRVVGIDLCHLFLIQTVGIQPVSDVHMLVRKGDRWVSVMVARGLLVEDANVGVTLGLVNLEVEVGSGLDFLVDILRESLLLLSPDLFFKAECFKLLLDKFVDTTLDVLDVFVVILVDLADRCEDTFLLLRAAELG
jgi:hypothetical protein